MPYPTMHGWYSLSVRQRDDGEVRAVLTHIDQATRRVVHEEVCCMIGELKSDLEIAELLAAAAWYHLAMRAPEASRETRKAVTGTGGALLPLRPSAPAGG